VKDKLIEIITPCLVWSLLRYNLVVCASNVAVMAVAGMSGSGIWSSGCGGCIVSECITIALLAVLGLCQSIRPVHSSASVAGVEAWWNGASASVRHLRISGFAGLLVASPEWRATSTRCVVVCWRRAVALLLLMMSDKEDLESGCDDEKENIDDCDSEDSCLEATSLT